jgi:hypothetical protein
MEREVKRQRRKGQEGEKKKRELLLPPAMCQTQHQAFYNLGSEAICLVLSLPISMIIGYVRLICFQIK